MFARKFLGGMFLVIAVLAFTGFMDAGLKRSDSQVKIEAKASQPGKQGAQTITVTLDVNPGWYIYANPVGNKEFENIQTSVAVLGKTGELDAKVHYPAGKTKTTGDTTYNVYQGKVTIQAKINRPDATPLTLSIKINACHEKGICLQQATVKVNVD